MDLHKVVFCFKLFFCYYKQLLNFKKKRSAFSEDKVQDLSIDIVNQVLKLNIWNYNNFHVFFPIEKNNEIDTKLIIQIIQGKDKNVILPRLNIENKSFVNFLLTDSTLLKENRLGIAEPQSGIKINENQIEVVFVPLLSYDKKGNRVGYGKGFYDTFLKNCKRDVVKIGLSFFDPVDHIKGIREEDVQLDYCVTPRKIQSF